MMTSFHFDAGTEDDHSSSQEAGRNARSADSPIMIISGRASRVLRCLDIYAANFTLSHDKRVTPRTYLRLLGK